MRRREFIAVFGAAVLAPHPLAAQAPSRGYRVAILAPVPEIALRPLFAEFRQQGLTEGENLTLDRRGVAAPYERLAALAADLVKARPDAILCAGDEAIRAARAATSTIPIVGGTDDMVGSAFARSLARPGGNTTA